MGGCLRSKTKGCHVPFRLLPHIRGNVGFVFTKEDLTEIRDMLLANKVREISPPCVFRDGMQNKTESSWWAPA